MIWDSILVLLVSTILAAALCCYRSLPGSETRLSLTVTIPRPAPAVFELLDDLSHVPVWHREPSWLPRSFRVSTMSRWGEYVPALRRQGSGDDLSPGEIHIRQIRNREVGYGCLHGKGFRFESTFLLAPDAGKCTLTWKVTYRSARLPDVLTRRLIAASVHRTMAGSLEEIQRLALRPQAPVRMRNRMVVESRGQVPAA